MPGNESLERAYELARARLGVDQQANDKTVSEQLMVSAAECRDLHRMAFGIGRAVDDAAAAGNRWPHYEREVADRYTLESIRPDGHFSNDDVFVRSEKGWILCERVRPPSRQYIEIEGQGVNVSQTTTIQGLLLTGFGKVVSYAASIPEDYPRRSGVDAWGEYTDDLYAEGYNNPPGTNPFEARVIGKVAILNPPEADGSDLREHDINLHSCSGSLDLQDLLAGIIVRFGIDPVKQGLISPALTA